MTDAPLRHDQCGIGGRGRAWQRDRGRAHDLADRRGQREARKHHAPDHVLAREDAERPTGGVDDGNRSDPPLLHRAQCIGEGDVRSRGDGVAAREILELRRHVAPRREIRDVFLLDPRAQRFQEVRKPVRAEIAKRRGAFDESVERRCGKYDAERVLCRPIARRRPAMAEKRAQCEHLARAELEQCLGAPGIGRLAAHGAVPDQVAMLRPGGRGSEDRVAAREVRDVRVAHEVGHVLRGHARERRVRQQGLHDAGHDRRCGALRAGHFKGGGSSARGVRPRPRITIAR